MKSTPAHGLMDELGKAWLLQRRQRSGFSKALQQQTGWGGFNQARPASADLDNAKEREKYYVQTKAKQLIPGTAAHYNDDYEKGGKVNDDVRSFKVPFGTQGVKEAAETPSLMLRNEVARRQRVRARLAKAKGGKP